MLAEQLVSLPPIQSDCGEHRKAALSNQKMQIGSLIKMQHLKIRSTSSLCCCLPVFAIGRSSSQRFHKCVSNNNKKKKESVKTPGIITVQCNHDVADGEFLAR